MSREIAELREVVKKLVPLLTGKGLQVTQRGSQAMVETDPDTLKPIRVNIPNISENASPDFIRAIQGFIDHEVAHVLITDWRFYGGGPSRADLRDPEVQKLINCHNIVEDTMIEREIVHIFPGSRRNIADLREHFICKITKPAVEAAETPEQRFSCLVVPTIRALAGHDEFQRFMDKENHWNDPMIKSLVDAFDSKTLEALKTVKTTQQTLVIARELYDILYKKGKSQDKPEKQADEGDGDGERDHSDLEKSEENEDQNQTSDQDEGQNQEGGQDDGIQSDDGSENETGADEKSGNSESDPGEAEMEGEDGDDGDAEGEPGDDSGSDGDDDGDGGSVGDLDANTSNNQGSGDEEETGNSGSGSDECTDESTGTGAGDDASGDVADLADGDAAGGGAQPDVNLKTDGARDDSETSLSDINDEAADGGDGVGSGGGKSMFEFEEDALEGRDLAREMMVAISNEAVEAIRHSDWSVFTTEYDKIEPLKVPKNLNANWVPQMDEVVRSMTGRMQKDIERIMASQSHVVNQPGHKKGRLHAPSLHRVVQNDSRVFTQRQEHKSVDTAVMLLVDNSGSMAGTKMRAAMLSSYALSTTLERVNIAHEMLGFTTGGYFEVPQKLRDDYDRETRETKIKYDRIIPIAMPVYKTFDERLNAQVKQRIAYALNAQRGLNANIDGESLQIAARRLGARSEKRKVMIVLSDGQPAGGPNSAAHLKGTVEFLNKNGIETIGIGIKSEAVSNFYENHVVLDEVANLPGQVMSEIKRILA